MRREAWGANGKPGSVFVSAGLVEFIGDAFLFIVSTGVCLWYEQRVTKLYLKVKLSEFVDSENSFSGLAVLVKGSVCVVTLHW